MEKEKDFARINHSTVITGKDEGAIIVTIACYAWDEKNGVERKNRITVTIPKNRVHEYLREAVLCRSTDSDDGVYIPSENILYKE